MPTLSVVKTSNRYFLFLFALITFLTFSIDAFAVSCDEVQCITCTYEYVNSNILFSVTADGNGSATVTRSSNKIDPNNRITYSFNSSTKNPIVASNFISSSSNKLVCPSKLYFKAPSNPGGTSIAFEISFIKFEDSAAETSLKNQDDNGKPFLVSGSSSAGKSCTYSGKMVTGGGSVPVTITRVQGELKYEIDNGYQVGITDLVVSDFPETMDGSCPNVYITCGSSGSNKFCTFSKNASIIDEAHGDPGQSGEGASDADEIGEENGTNPETPIDNPALTSDLNLQKYCNESNVARTLKFIGILLFIAKMFVPALIIIMGSVDFAQVIFAGKDDEIKKRLSIFIKRFITGVIIFFIPTIINFFFSVLDGYSDAMNKYSNCRACILDIDNCNTSG